MVFANSRWWYLSLGMVFLASAGMSTQMTLSPTLVQIHADPNYRSRMQGLLFMAQGLGSFGAFFTGALSKVIGIQWAGWWIGRFAFYRHHYILDFYQTIKKIGLTTGKITSMHGLNIIIILIKL